MSDISYIFVSAIETITKPLFMYDLSGPKHVHDPKMTFYTRLTTIRVGQELYIVREKFQSGGLYNGMDVVQVINCLAA